MRGLAIALLLAACTKVPVPPSVTPRFAAFGGVGVVPVPTPPDYETQFAVLVVDLDNPSAAIRNIRVRDAVLVDGKGTTVATLQHVVHVVTLPQDPTPTPRDDGSWHFYLDTVGAPFDGTLPTGTLRLRVRVSLRFATPQTAWPETIRLTLGDLVIERKLDGSWPT